MTAGLARVFALALASAPAGAWAEDAVAAPGRLSDADFYRLVGCAAPPGAECQRPFVRWPTERPIRVALRRIDRAYLGGRKQRAGAALARAVQAVNGSDAAFHLAQVAATVPAEIEVFFLDIDAAGVIGGTGIAGVDGFPVGGAAATRLLVTEGTDEIQRAAIVFTTSLETAAYEAEMLTQLTRAMGLMTEVSGPAYARRSALSTAPHDLTRLAPQDAVALRSHYDGRGR